MLTYTVVTPFIAVEPGETLFYIPAEASITVASEVRGNGLVDVLYEGKRVAAFLRDIKARAEPVHEPTPDPPRAFSFAEK